jgi:hypothetical protein
MEAQMVDKYVDICDEMPIQNYLRCSNIDNFQCYFDYQAWPRSITTLAPIDIFVSTVDPYEGASSCRCKYCIERLLVT